MTTEQKTPSLLEALKACRVENQLVQAGSLTFLRNALVANNQRIDAAIAAHEQRGDEIAALEAVMKNIDPARWPGLSATHRAALGRFAKPDGAMPFPGELVQLLRVAVERVKIANSEGDPILSAWLPEALSAIAKAEGK